MCTKQQKQGGQRGAGRNDRNCNCAALLSFPFAMFWCKVMCSELKLHMKGREAGWPNHVVTLTEYLACHFGSTVSLSSLPVCDDSSHTVTLVLACIPNPIPASAVTDCCSWTILRLQ